MTPAIEKLIEAVMAREGGFVNNPADKGGATNFGVTAATLGQYRGYSVPADTIEVKALTYAEAKAILLQEYVAFPGLENKSEALQELLVDFAIHSGKTRAIKYLQRCLNVKVDGIIGAETKAAVIAIQPEKIYPRLLAARARFIGSILQKDPSQTVFAAGWIYRIAEFIEKEV